MDLDTAPAPPVIEAHRLRFTGDGGIYMGVWLVNLLLMVVTLGIYTPFARRRTLKYFYANTLVARSPLEFTGGLRRMVMGFLLFFGLYLAYAIASHTEQDVAAAVIIFGWLLLTPWLWASATRFRLASTRWRGIRFHFGGTNREVYKVSWPYIAMLLMFAAVSAVFALMGPKPPPLVVLAVIFGAMVAALVLLVLLEFNYARLRVQRSDFGGQPGRWKAEFKDFVRISAVAFGLFLAASTLLTILVAVGVGASFWMFRDLVKSGDAAIALMTVVGTFAGLIVMYLSISPALAYREARKFALVWGTLGMGNIARFTCTLRPWPYVRLRIKNVLLSIVSGGFYRPFAVTSEYRMRLESVTLHVKGNLDELAGALVSQDGTFADALADAVGFDVVG